MNYLKSKSLILYFISGVIAAYSVLHALFLLSWLCYIPFFFLLRKETKKNLFIPGFVFGLGVSAVNFFWMIGAAKEFSGNNLAYGVFITSLSVFGLSAYWSVLTRLIGFVSQKTNYNKNLNALAVASCVVLCESILSCFFSEAPYYLYNSGYGLLNNLYFIQWASFFGLSFLGLIVVFVNGLFADALIRKNWKALLLPSILIIVFFIGGTTIISTIKQITDSAKSITVAIVSENVPPELHWDQFGGDILADRLLSLNKTAQGSKPDITLWSECAIPWTYTPDDPLINEIIKASQQSNTTHIIGCNSEYGKNKVFNSVYGLSPEGKILGRYDKRYLLSFIETPTLGLSVPFFDLAGSFIKSGIDSKPIATPFGKAGIIICNEVVNPEATLTVVKNGADFLFNPSNDGWFKDSYIVDLHFLYARLSAVINRRDIVVNSNDGISGHIKASGEIQMKRRTKEMFVQTVAVSSNTFDNSDYYYPMLIIVFCLFIVAYSLFKAL